MTESTNEGFCVTCQGAGGWHLVEWFNNDGPRTERIRAVGVVTSCGPMRFELCTACNGSGASRD